MTFITEEKFAVFPFFQKQHMTFLSNFLFTFQCLSPIKDTIFWFLDFWFVCLNLHSYLGQKLFFPQLFK